MKTEYYFTNKGFFYRTVDKDITTVKRFSWNKNEFIQLDSLEVEGNKAVFQKDGKTYEERLREGTVDEKAFAWVETSEVKKSEYRMPQSQRMRDHQDSMRKSAQEKRAQDLAAQEKTKQDLSARVSQGPKKGLSTSTSRDRSQPL